MLASPNSINNGGTPCTCGQQSLHYSPRAWRTPFPRRRKAPVNAPATPTRSAWRARSRSTPPAARVRLRAIQDARLPADEGGGVHVRRRSLAQQHARRARRAGAALHQGDVLPDRQACAVASGDPQGGRRGRPHDRRAHLVACQSRQRSRATRRPRKSRRASARSRSRSAPRRRRSSGFPFLQDKGNLDYLGSRNIAVFSHDLDSFDFKARTADTVIEVGHGQAERKGKGIILMHDFQQATAAAMPGLLNELKAKGYKVVHMKAKTPLATIAQWDDAARKRDQERRRRARPADIERRAHGRGTRGAPADRRERCRSGRNRLRAL